MKKVAIIGGGILGLAIGYKLSLLTNDFSVTVLKKNLKLDVINQVKIVVYYIVG